MSERRLRAGAFVAVGLAFAAYWVLADRGRTSQTAQTQWPYILGFSALFLALAVALPLLGRLAVSGRATRVAAIPAAGAGLASAGNIVEDGLGLGWASWAFVAGVLLVELGLLAFTGVLAFAGSRSDRLLALVPAGTVVGVALFSHLGGPLLLALWVATAVVALRQPR